MLVLNTIPKSGTHLLMDVAKKLGYVRHQPDGWRYEHTPYDPSLIKDGDTHLILIRDPRDMAVSLFHFGKAGRGGDWLQEVVRTVGDDGQLMAVVVLSIIARRLSSFDGWTKDPRVLTLRFEDLIQDQFGGSKARREESARRLGAWIGRDPAEVEAALDVGTDNDTFRRGVAGAWREELEPRFAEHFSRYWAELLERWGYPID